MAPNEQRYLDERKAEEKEEFKLDGFENKRWNILADATTCVVKDRNKAYGEPKENHQRIAALWSVILEREVKPHEAALCMAAVKMARLIATPNHRDSWVDGCGYFALGMECLEDD
tara:strand:+ start:210 stop:554 length:345 start_codon:yes stop_codon:yes gene_type:complete